MAVSISEDLSWDDSSAEVVDLCPWSERLDYAGGLLGGWRSIGGFMTFTSPASYAYIPSLVCKNVKTDHDGSIDANGDWALAKLTITYGRPESQVTDFGEISLDVNAEALSVPGRNFTWTSGPDSGKVLKVDTDVSPSVVIPGITIKLKRKHPFLMLSAMTTTIGKINSSALNIAGYSFDAQTVMFAGAQAQRKLTNDGSELWDYDFNFTARPNSWNKFFHKSGWQTVNPAPYGFGDLAFFFS